MKKVVTLTTFLVVTLISFGQSTSPTPYCDASFDDMQGFPVDDHINSVSFGTINNVTNAQFAAPHYVHYNNLAVANFTKGSTYTLTVKFTTAGGCGYGVWIDYNHNNTFEAAEKIAGTTTNTLAVGATPTITQSVTIPATAVTGNTRMRVRIVEDDTYSGGTNFSELPCNLSTSPTDVMDWGETEDYTINITGTTPIHIKDFISVKMNDGVKNIVNYDNAFNNLRYEFQRSIDSKNFETFKTIEATNVSNATLQAIDNTAFTGTVFYRFKSIDKDGAVSYSKVNAVTKDNNAAEISIFPNPATNQIQVINLNSLSNYSITNSDGRQCKKGVLNNTKTIDISTLPKGVYYINFYTDNSSTVHKLLVN